MKLIPDLTDMIIELEELEAKVNEYIEKAE